VWWKTVPEVGAGNWKSPFSDGGKVERRDSKLVGGSRPELTCMQHDWIKKSQQDQIRSIRTINKNAEKTDNNQLLQNNAYKNSANRMSENPGISFCGTDCWLVLSCGIWSWHNCHWLRSCSRSCQQLTCSHHNVFKCCDRVSGQRLVQLRLLIQIIITVIYSINLQSQQESWAIAKMTAGARPENFREFLTTATATFPEKFNGLLFQLSL